MTSPSLLSDEQLRVLAQGLCAKPMPSWALFFCVRRPKHVGPCMDSTQRCVWCGETVVPAAQGLLAPVFMFDDWWHDVCSRARTRELHGADEAVIETERGRAA